MNYAVIMAGGYGERFWPLSRIHRPKQCLAINTKKPMIQETVDRLSKTFDLIYISTGQTMAKEIRKILPKQEFILEPMARNTAACIGLSAMFLLSKDKDSVMFLETSDHVYNDVKKYIKLVKRSLNLAKSTKKIIMFGIKPTSPHTGYGYIEQGTKSKDSDVFLVKSFKEKPNLGVAKLYLKSGKFLWNSGMFVSRCDVMIEEIKQYMPNLYGSLIRIKNSKFKNSVLVDEFKRLEKISIDYGIMEKSKNTLVLKADIDWDDLGDLASFERFLKKDKEGNVAIGKYIGIDSNNNIIISKKFVSTIGIKDSIIIDTPDALLITKKENVQEVKKIVNELNQKGFIDLI